MVLPAAVEISRTEVRCISDLEWKWALLDEVGEDRRGIKSSGGQVASQNWEMRLPLLRWEPRGKTQVVVESEASLWVRVQMCGILHLEMAGSHLV